MSRILANAIVGLLSVVGRAGLQAWRQAIINGQKAGISPDAARPGVLRGKGMALEEALKVLNVEPGTPWPKVKEHYERMFEANQSGSFYLQSKVVRAYERLGQERGEDVSGLGGQQQQSAGNPFGGFAASGVPREGEDKDSGDQQKQ